MGFCIYKTEIQRISVHNGGVVYISRS